MQRTEIEISGMTCGHCAMSITKELEKIDGTAVFEVNHQTGKALVEGSATESELSAAIERAGYQATKFVKVND